MENGSFDRLVNQLSDEAEQGKVKEARLVALHHARERRRQLVIGSLIAVLYGVVFYKHTEINDQVAGLFSRGEPEYQSINNLSAEVDAEKAGAESATVDPTGRKAKLKNALVKAKNHAAIVDEIMDDDPAAAAKKTQK